MKKIIIIAVIFVVIVNLFIVGFFFVFPKKHMSIISKYASEYNLPASVVASVINIESGYDNLAISDAGAIGLMQLMPSTADEISEKLSIDKYDLKDIETNIMFGCYYLRYLLNLFDNNLINSLCAYNWGLRNVQDWLNKGNIDSDGNITNIPIKETKGYIEKFKINKFVYSKIYKMH